MTTNKKYVYKNTEVVLTGREATKPKRQRQVARRGNRISDVMDKLVEIKSVDEKLGILTWVRMDELFEVIE